jgi:hypothetical protein
VQLLVLVALVEHVHRHDAAPPRIGIAEHALVGDGFGPRIDWPQLRARFHPVRNQPPAQLRLGDLAGLMPPPHRKRGVRRGREAAALDARGATLGGLGMIGFAGAIYVLIEHSAALALVAATALWASISVLAWLWRGRH